MHTHGELVIWEKTSFRLLANTQIERINIFEMKLGRNTY